MKEDKINTCGVCGSKIYYRQYKGKFLGQFAIFNDNVS